MSEAYQIVDMPLGPARHNCLHTTGEHAVGWGHCNVWGCTCDGFHYINLYYEWRRLYSGSSRDRGTIIEVEVNQLTAEGWEVFNITTLSPVTEIVWLRRPL